MALAAGWSGVAGERQGEGAQFVYGVTDEGVGVVAGLVEGAGRTWAALPGGGGLDRQLPGGTFQLAYQPVHPGGGPALAGRGDRYRAAHQRCPQVSGDLDGGDGRGYPQGAVHHPIGGQFGDRLLQVPGRIAQLRGGEDRPYWNA